MKKIALCIALITFAFVFCVKQQKIDKVLEGDIEVILNHIEPYEIKGTPSTFVLEEIASIDLEREDVGEKGFAKAILFDVDSDGNVYFAQGRTKEYWIHKLDSTGTFITSFGKMGQGPGEIQGILHFEVDSQDNIVVIDFYNKKVLKFHSDGAFMDEIPIPSNLDFIYPLPNGNYFARRTDFPEGNEDNSNIESVYCVYNNAFELIEDLDRYHTPYPITKGFRGANIEAIFHWKVSSRYIYVGNELRDYEILKFDFNGKLLQKIRKEYNPVPVSSEFKQKRKEAFEEQGMRIWFPEHWTPFCSFFLDDHDNMFVMTFEEGDSPKEYIYDVFNSDGIFIGRKALNIYIWAEREVLAKVKGNQLYCLQEKESGFRKLVTYKMTWQ